MDDRQQDEAEQEARRSPQAGSRPTGQAPQGSGSDPQLGDRGYQPGQGGKGGSGYQPGQSEMAGGRTSRPEENRGSDASES